MRKRPEVGVCVPRAHVPLKAARLDSSQSLLREPEALIRFVQAPI